MKIWLPSWGMAEPGIRLGSGSAEGRLLAILLFGCPWKWSCLIAEPGCCMHSAPGISLFLCFWWTPSVAVLSEVYPAEGICLQNPLLVLCLAICSGSSNFVVPNEQGQQTLLNFFLPWITFSNNSKPAFLFSSRSGLVPAKGCYVVHHNCRLLEKLVLYKVGKKDMKVMKILLVFEVNLLIIKIVLTMNSKLLLTIYKYTLYVSFKMVSKIRQYFWNLCFRKPKEMT